MQKGQLREQGLGLQRRDLHTHMENDCASDGLPCLRVRGLRIKNRSQLKVEGHDRSRCVSEVSTAGSDGEAVGASESEPEDAFQHPWFSRVLHVCRQRRRPVQLADESNTLIGRAVEILWRGTRRQMIVTLPDGTQRSSPPGIPEAPVSTPPVSDSAPQQPLQVSWRGRVRSVEVPSRISVSQDLSMPDVQMVPSLSTDNTMDVEVRAAQLALQTLDNADESIVLLDLNWLCRQMETWKMCLPHVSPFYAVKCNPDPRIIKQMMAMGSGFDCASLSEIDLVLSLGASADRVVFANPCKPRGHIRFAKAHGVSLMTFDNETELHKISQEFGTSARLLLRLRCDDSQSQCPMSMKFGAGPGSWEQLLRTAKHLELQVVGVSFHVGSGCQEATCFEKALQDASSVFGHAQALGFQMTILDIGGGFPGSDEGVCVKFATLAATITAQLERFFPEQGLQLIAEPGRFFASGSQALLTKVIAKAQVGDETMEPCFRYYLNDGLYGSFNSVLYDHASVQVERLPREMRRAALSAEVGGEEKLHQCCLFGPTCDGFDLILKDHWMQELQEGEWLLWREMGAYTTAAGSSFNGFQKPHVWYYRSS